MLRLPIRCQLDRRVARRVVMDVLVILCAVVGAFIVVDALSHDTEKARAVAITRESVRAIQGQLDMNVVSESGAIGDRTYPVTIDERWFEGRKPINALLGPGRPWMESASLDELTQVHPSDITVRGGKGAMFWYNPVTGVVRARVPRTLTDAEAIGIYNEVNGTAYGGPTETAQVTEP